MRRGLTLFLVTLLVLRGLLGDAMAMGAALGVVPMPTGAQLVQPFTGGHGQHRHSAADTNTNAHDRVDQADPTGHGSYSKHSNPAEHMGLGAPAGHDSGTPTSLASAAISANAPAAHAACPSSNANTDADTAACGHEHGAGCSACGICHSAVFVAGLWAQPSPPQPSTLPAVGHTQFDSAAAALVTKPPIS